MEHGFTLDRFARDAFEVADATGAERVIGGEWEDSMSGKFGQYLAVRPDRVEGQILLSGAPASPIPLPEETVRDWVGRAGDRDRLREVMAMFTSQPVAPEVLDRCAMDATKATRTALGETLNMCTQTTFAEQLGGLRIPTLVVGGATDPIFSPEVLRHGVAGPIAGARLALLDSNHEIPNRASARTGGRDRSILGRSYASRIASSHDGRSCCGRNTLTTVESGG